jgi:hypothetical protein
MAKDLVRRIERIELQQPSTTSGENGLIDQIFRSGSIPAPSRKEFPNMLRRAMDQIDGRARLIPRDRQIISKGVYQ